MKQKTPLSLGAICAVFANCVMATEWNVSTVAALTNAVTQAMPGDKIILAQGKYTFTDEWMENDGTGKCLLVVTNDNITIEGAVATPRATWTDHDEPVIIDGAGLGAIVKVDQSNKSPQWQVRNRLTIRHLTFTGSSYRGVAFANGVTSAQYDFVKCTNCVFRQNSWTVASSTTYMFNWGEMRDCLVTNNIVGTGGNALLGSMVVYGSDIVGNATAGTSVMRSVTAYDCTVRGNNAANVVQGVDSDTPKVYSNCTFSANTTTSDLSIYGTV